MGGGTDLGIDVAHGRTNWDTIYSIHRIDVLRRITKRKSELVIGGAVTWQEALPYIERYWSSFGEIVRRFGSPQVRSVGTLAGNLATASPIGDGSVCLLALDASVILTGSRERRVPLRDFFVGYRRSVLRATEVIRSIHIPLPRRGDVFLAAKVSKRYDQDISTVCGAVWVQSKKTSKKVSSQKIESVRIAYGGMSEKPERCYPAERVMTGEVLSESVCESAATAVRKQFDPLTDFRGSSDYRLLVASNLFNRLVHPESVMDVMR